MTRKRGLAGLVVGLVVATASPAFAQTGATAKVTAPGDGAVIVGSQTVSGSGSSTAGVKSVKLFIEGELVASKEPSDLRQNVDVSYGWATSSLRNGWYQLRVDVAANGGASDSSHINVKVDNAPQPPSNLTSSVKGQTVSLSWSPNPEADITGYRVEVSAGGAEWTSVTQTQGTDYAAEVAPGSYEYRVVALRSSPTMDGGRPSDPSSPVSLSVAAPPSAPADGGLGGKGRGYTGGGDPRVYGKDGGASAREVRKTARAFSGGGTGFSFGNISLPGSAGLPSLPGTGDDFEWGTYKERLPYSIPQGGVPLDLAPPRLAALSTTKVIPLDALRWVGAGVLMIVLAMFLQFFGWRSDTISKLEAEGAAALKISKPAVSLKDANVRIRRLQDRVRAARKKTGSS
ncbi:MAG: hypothetical protein QOG16_698 [Actinomycetota bacterium]|nr:hypothetical protein [Actinomycetota bacterium]